VSDVPMGPRPAIITQTTKEVNQLSPQSKKRRSSQKASDESGPDEQTGDQPEPESQVQQSDDQPEPEAQAQSPEKEKPDDQPEPEAQAQSPEEKKADDQPEEDDQPSGDSPEEAADQSTVADVLKRREETVRLHNERAGGGDVHEGELQNQLDEHNQRVGDASL
jgi:hypothetical protein